MIGAVLKLDQTLKRASQIEVAERVLGGETLLVPIRRDTKEKVNLFTLNEVGTRVWSELKSQSTPERLAELISNEFEIGRDQALTDVTSFLERLRALGLVEEVSHT